MTEISSNEATGPPSGSLTKSDRGPLSDKSLVKWHLIAAMSAMALAPKK